MPDSPAEADSRSNRITKRAIHFWRRTVRGLKKVDALITAVATVLLAVITGALTLIAYWQYSDTTLRESLIASNRAWLSADGIVATGDIAGDKDVPLQVLYANAGKSPATKIKNAFFARTLTNPNKSDYESITVGPNNTCDGLRPETDGIAAFPSQTRQHWIETFYPRKLIPPNLSIADEALVLQGCFAYETMHEVHHTWFCYIVYRNGKLATAAASTNCNDGHGAD